MCAVGIVVQTCALPIFNLTVPRSSLVALLGANGAGKTTLLRVASGQLRPATGSVVLDDRDMTGKRPEQLARRGLCHVLEGLGHRAIGNGSSGDKGGQDG